MATEAGDLGWWMSQLSSGGYRVVGTCGRSIGGSPRNIKRP